MKNLICLICFLISCSFLQAQKGDLIIEYNLFNDQITYKKDGKVVDKPYIKDRKNIIVKVLEFNPYTTKANLKVNAGSYNQSTNPQNAGYPGGDPMGSMTGGGGSFQGISGLLSNLGLGATGARGMPSSRGVLDQQGELLSSSFEAALQKLQAAEKEVNLHAQKLELYQNVDASLQLAAMDIISLKNNTKIKPSRIKEMIEEEVLHAFAKNENESIDITDLVNKDKQQGDIQGTVNKYKMAVQKYQSLLPEWYSIAAAAMNYENTTGNQQIAHIQESTNQIIASINGAQQYDDGSLNALVQSGGNAEVELLSNLRQVYEELQSSDFTYSFPPIQAKGDKIQISLEFLRKEDRGIAGSQQTQYASYNNNSGGQQNFGNQYDGQYQDPNQSNFQQQGGRQNFQQYQQQSQFYANQTGDFKPYKTLDQTIPVSGTWKVTGGVGISFGALKDPRFNYSIRESKIVAQEMDQFIPIVTSFAHFYKQSPGNVNIGGSFGVGLPILGGADIQAASFFLGPTIILGESSRFLLSGGVMGAKATRLAAGLQVGDTFDTITDAIPTVDRYELGYFIGLSFSILK